MIDERSKKRTTEVEFSPSATKRLFEGLEIAAKAVATTLGPKGKTVIIQREDGTPLVTKDGVTVCRSIDLADPVKRMGAALVKESASATNNVAGDGTTTSTVLTLALVAEGLRLRDAGFSSRALCEGIERAAFIVDKHLEDNAIPVKSRADLAKVATVSANGDSKIGDLIADAMEKVGSDGIITVEDAVGMMTTMTLVEGMQFERGYVSPYFVTNPERMVSTYVDAVVLVTDKKLSTLGDIVPAMEAAAKFGHPLLIIADDIENEAMNTAVVNVARKNISLCVVKAPAHGQRKADMLADICALTGAKLLSSATGGSLTSPAQCFGTVKKFIVDAKSTTLVVSQASEALKEHVNNVRELVADPTLSAEDLAWIRSRLARLTGGVAVVKVGGATEVEMVERKARVEDALNATKAAAIGGVVPGGGLALLEAARIIDRHGPLDTTITRDVKTGMDVLFSALKAPISRIVANADMVPEVVIAEITRICSPGVGFNAATGEYVNMVDAGIIDPANVTRSALRHAVSVALTFLQLDAVVYDV